MKDNRRAFDIWVDFVCPALSLLVVAAGVLDWPSAVQVMTMTGLAVAVGGTSISLRKGDARGTGRAKRSGERLARPGMLRGLHGRVSRRMRL